VGFSKENSADKMSAGTNEEFDEDGNVIKVENLTFISGVLGQGSYGTVRLAKRKLAVPPLPSNPRTPIAASRSMDEDDHQFFSSSPAPLNNRRRKHRPQRKFLSKSMSAPNGQNEFFSEPVVDNEATTPSSATAAAAVNESTPSSNKQHPRDPHVKSPSVVGNLGLFIRSKVSFDSPDGGEEQLVAVKIFQKSILKRKRTMERDKSTHRVKIQTALQQVEREIALMKKLSHPNLVAMYEVIDSPESDMLYLVIEYCSGGEILTYQEDGTFRRKDPRPASKHKQHAQGVVNGHFDEETAALYFVDILHGLAYLHQVRISFVWMFFAHTYIASTVNTCQSYLISSSFIL
jgi:serine/threonine protein kinase